MLQYVRIREHAMKPTKAYENDAGWDVYSIESIVLRPGQRHTFKLGLVMAVPPNQFLRVAPRSGLAYAEGFDTLAGTIDAGYREEIGIVVINLGFFGLDGHPVAMPYTVKQGDKIAQIIIRDRVMDDNILEVGDVSMLPPSERGARGFASTGR